jgi:hypothetical protein
MGNGGSKSSNKTVINNNTINTTDIQALDKTTLNVGVDVLNKAAQNCSSTVAQNNACNFGNINTAGDFNFSSAQTNSAQTNLSCINDQKVSADMTNAMMSSVMGSLDSLNNTSSGGALNAAAQAKSETSFGATGGGSTSNVNGEITNNITNDTKVVVQNILENNFKQNFTAETLSNCINRTTQNNEIKFGDVDADKANIACVQTNTLQQVTECKAMQDAISSTIMNAVKDLGFEVKADNTSETKSDATTASTAESKSTGLVDDLFNGIASVIDSAFGGALAGPIISIVCLICCIIVFYMWWSGKIGGSGSSNSTGVPSSTFPIPMSFMRQNGGNAETSLIFTRPCASTTFRM